MCRHSSQRQQRRETTGHEQRHQDVSPSFVLRIFCQHQSMPKHAVRIRSHKQHAGDKHRDLSSAQCKCNFLKAGQVNCISNRNCRQECRPNDCIRQFPLTQGFVGKPAVDELVDDDKKVDTGKTDRCKNGRTQQMQQHRGITDQIDPGRVASEYDLRQNGKLLQHIQVPGRSTAIQTPTAPVDNNKQNS